MMTARIIPATALWLAVLSPSWAEVRVQVPQGPVSLSQPFDVTIESTGSASGPPDLTPLQHDFQILNRRLSTQTSVLNGTRVQRTSLSLSLLPKRSGNLALPSITIAGEYSLPQSIKVLPGADPAQTPAQAPASSTMANPWEMSGMQTPQMPSFGFPSPPPAPPFPTTDNFPVQSQSFSSQPAPQVPWSASPPGPSRVEPQPPPPATSPQPDPGQAGGYPDWLVAGLIMGWIATLVFCWVRRRQAGVEKATIQPPILTPIPASVSPPESELERAVHAVRTAYEQGEAKQAREALLHWARINWSEQAPNNLTQLAGRFEGSLKAGILALDAALYSPTPLPWNQLNLADMLPPVRPRGASGGVPLTR